MPVRFAFAQVRAEVSVDAEPEPDRLVLRPASKQAVRSTPPIDHAPRSMTVLGGARARPRLW